MKNSIRVYHSIGVHAPYFVIFFFSNEFHVLLHFRIDVLYWNIYEISTNKPHNSTIIAKWFSIFHLSRFYIAVCVICTSLLCSQYKALKDTCFISLSGCFIYHPTLNRILQPLKIILHTFIKNFYVIFKIHCAVSVYL